MTVRFGVLGPLRVEVDGKEVRIGASKPRALLALLVVRRGEWITREQVAAELWGAATPRSAASNLRTYLAGLRALALPGVRLVTDGGHYRLDADPDAVEVDAETFEAQAGAAQRRLATEPHAALAGLRRALRLWRGPVLDQVPQGPLLGAWSAALTARRRAVVEDYLQAALDTDDLGSVITAAHRVLAADPTRERVWAQLMLAQYRGGDVDAALASYRAARSALVGELGVEPGAELAGLHAAVLSRDPALLEAPAAGPVDVPPPRQLPADVPQFVGRRDAMAALGSALEPPALVVVSGAPGIGKTALAVHAAHLAAGRFPDGQLFVDLRGHGGEPAGTDETLGVVLDAFAGAERPENRRGEALVGAFRSALADRRLLLVLDDAAGAGQVRPLLPGGPHCAVLVTSRDRLTGLVARNGARRLDLDVPPADEAVAVLAGILGADRVAREPAAARRLAALCGHLPLALRIAAARIADRPGRSLADHVTELHDQLYRHGRLAALAVPGDDGAALRAAFDSSYLALPEPARRMFRLLALLPSGDFDVATVATLAGLDRAITAELLDELICAHLVEPGPAGRCTMHRLLRLYARERRLADDR